MIDVFQIDPFVLSYNEYVYLAIGLGMLVSLLYSETLGVIGGGVIVPGYFALHLQDLPSVFITFLIAALTYFFISVLSKYLLIYGRRRVILSLMIASHDRPHMRMHACVNVCIYTYIYTHNRIQVYMCWR